MGRLIFNNLSAQLASDGTTAAGDQYHLAVNISLNYPIIQYNRFSA